MKNHKGNTQEIEQPQDSKSLLLESAKEIASGFFQLYMTEGLDKEDYEFCFGIYNEALLYFQRKRG